MQLGDAIGRKLQHGVFVCFFDKLFDMMSLQAMKRLCLSFRLEPGETVPELIHVDLLSAHRPADRGSYFFVGFLAFPFSLFLVSHFFVPQKNGLPRQQLGNAIIGKLCSHSIRFFVLNCTFHVLPFETMVRLILNFNVKQIQAQLQIVNVNVLLIL